MMNDDQTTYKNKRLTKAHVAQLYSHGIQIVATKELGKRQVKVKASQFKILVAERSISPLAIFVNGKLEWQEISSSYFYFEKELIEFALQCLYLTNTLLGECIVQRFGKKNVAVVDIRSLTLTELTEIEQQMVVTQIQGFENKNRLTFGCDLELMLVNKQTNKYICGDLLVKNSEIGFDDAISLSGGRVFHPVFEVRPKSADSMEQLHENLLVLHSKLRKEIIRHQLTIITDADPFKRFLIGGHIHFGNIPLTFHYIRLLDQFLAIPFSKVEVNPSFKRRNYYGRLGSVRTNKFQGFEYRVLPSWFKQIPEFLPILQWIEFLLKNADKLPDSKIAEIDLKGYYQNDYIVRSLDEWEDENKRFFIEYGGETEFTSFVNTLKKLL